MRRKPRTKVDDSLKKVPEIDIQQRSFETSPLRFEMEIILQEFRELRAEILAKNSNEQQIINYSIALIVATATIMQLETQITLITGSETGMRILILIISLLFSALGLMYIEQDMYIATTGKYINQVLSPKLNEIIYKVTGVEKEILEWEKFRIKSVIRFPHAIAFTIMSSARYALPIFPAFILLIYYFVHRSNNIISIGENLLFWFTVFVALATIIIAIIDGISFLGIDSAKKIDSLSNLPRYHILKRFWHEGFFVPGLTIMLGIFPMIILSFQSGTLWFSPYVDFPLFAIPSVFIGDTIFLPWFNFKLYRLLVQTRSFVINSLFFLKIAILVGISYFINSYTHLVWVSDQYLGFMDMQPGKLSPAGIWHLWFSIFQFALIILAVWVSIDFYSKKDFQALNSIGKIWQIIVWFSALIIPDFLIRHLFIFKDANNPQQLIKDLGSVSTLIISIIVLLIIRYLTSRLISRSGTQS